MDTPAFWAMDLIVPMIVLLAAAGRDFAYDISAFPG